jgi:hypothetical protein
METRRLIATVWGDVRYAMRTLRARPGFAAVAIVTLALGIGANTAIFSVVRSLVLEPLPFRSRIDWCMLWEADAARIPTARRRQRAELPRLAARRERP